MTNDVYSQLKYENLLNFHRIKIQKLLLQLKFINTLIHMEVKTHGNNILEIVEKPSTQTFVNGSLCNKYKHNQIFKKILKLI